MLRGDEPDVGHDAAGARKPARIAQLGGDRQRRQIIDAAEAAQPPGARGYRLEREAGLQLGVDRREPGAPRPRRGGTPRGSAAARAAASAGAITSQAMPSSDKARWSSSGRGRPRSSTAPAQAPYLADEPPNRRHVGCQLVQGRLAGARKDDRPPWYAALRRGLGSLSVIRALQSRARSFHMV